MSLEIFCSNVACKRRYLLPATASGKSVRCKACGETFVAGASVTVNAPELLVGLHSGFEIRDGGPALPAPKP